MSDRHLKTVSALAAGVFVWSVAAQAADLPPPAPARVIPPAPVVQQAPPLAPLPSPWTGVYIGGHAGYGWGDFDLSAPAGAGGFVQAFSDDFDTEGFVGGGQVGFNYQWGSFVGGIEGTISYTDFDDNQTNPVGDGDNWDIRSRFLVTAVARLGLAFGDWLAYVKGGYAGARVKIDFADIIPQTAFFDTSRWHDGYTLGLGLSYLINPWIIFGVEYNYYDLERNDHNATDSNGNAQTASVNPDFHSILARVNFKFWTQ